MWHWIVGIPVVGIAGFLLRWFLLKTDVMVGYSWTFSPTGSHPNFDIRNRSSSRSYTLGNIKYTRSCGKEIVAFDNQSLWGKELKPGAIVHIEGAVLSNIKTPQQCWELGIAVRLQNEREFQGQGPGHLYTGIRKYAFALREKLERLSVPL